MLRVNQQTIAGAQQSAAKLALFSNPKTRSISCPKTGCAARGLLSLSWAARRLETCLKTFTHKPPVKFRQQMPANRPWWLTPFWGPKFEPQNGVSPFESFFLHFAFLWLRRCSIHRPAQAFIIAAAQQVATVHTQSWIKIRMIY